MRNSMKTALVLILASGMATSVMAQTNDGTSAAAGTTSAGDTGNAFAGGDKANMPADKIVEMLGMADGAMVGKMIGDVASIKDVRVVTLSELSEAQNIDVAKLNAALAMQDPMIPMLKTDIAGSAVVGDALKSKGFTANQVVAAAASEGTNQVLVVVDDRT